MEQIFNLPELGRYFLEAVTKRNHCIISGWNLSMSPFVLGIIVLTDVAYAYVDHVRYRWHDFIPLLIGTKDGIYP